MDNPEHAEIEQLIMMGTSSFSYYIAEYLTKDLVMLADNVLVLLIIYALCLYIIFRVSAYFRNVKAMLTKELEERVANIQHITQLQITMHKFLIWPVGYILALLSLLKIVFVQKLSVTMGAMMMTFLPNSANGGDPTKDATLQILPPIMFFGGLLYLVAYAFNVDIE